MNVNVDFTKTKGKIKPKTEVRFTVEMQFRSTMQIQYPVRLLQSISRSRRWQGSIKIKSNKHTENTSGTIKITKPDYLASVLGEFRFDDIGPLQTLRKRSF